MHMPMLKEEHPSWMRPEKYVPMYFKPKKKEFAIDIIKTLNDQWKALMSSDNSSEGVSRTCTQYECSEKVSAEEANASLEAASPVGEAGDLADAVDKWHHVKLSNL